MRFRVLGARARDPRFLPVLISRPSDSSDESRTTLLRIYPDSVSHCSVNLTSKVRWTGISSLGQTEAERVSLRLPEPSTVRLCSLGQWSLNGHGSFVDWRSHFEFQPCVECFVPLR